MMQRLFDLKLFFYGLAFLSSLPTIMMLVSIGFNGDPRFFNDATAFYCAGRMTWDLNLNPYDFAHQLACSESYGRSFSAFFYPPFSLAIFSLWAVVPYNFAIAAMVVASILSLGYIYSSMWQMYLSEVVKPRERLVPVLICIWMALSQVAFMQIPFGQINLIAMACCVAAVKTMRLKPTRSGIYFALIGALKTPFAFLGLAAITKFRPRLIAAAVVAAMIMMGFVVALRGFDPFVSWLQASLDYASYAGLVEKGYPPILERDNVSLFSLLYHQVGYAQAITLMMILSPAIGLISVYILWRSRKLTAVDFDRFAFAVLPAVSYLISSLTWRCYYIYIFPLLFLLLRQYLANQKRWGALLLFFSLLLSHEIGFFMPGEWMYWPTLSVIYACTYVVISPTKLTT